MGPVRPWRSSSFLSVEEPVREIQGKEQRIPYSSVNVERGLWSAQALFADATRRVEWKGGLASKIKRKNAPPHLFQREMWPRDEGEWDSGRL